jgi:CBS domain-containing protein
MPSLGTVTAREYMTTDLLTFSPHMDVMAAIRLLVKHGHSGAPVVDESGKVLGMLSEKDCLKVAVLSNYEGVSPGLVRDFMAQSVTAVRPDTSLLEVASRFIDAPYKRLPVVEDGRLLGQISRSDVLRAIDDLS